MQFQATNLRGVFVIDLDRHVDERGFFARVWCREDFSRQGLVAELSQISLAHTTKKGTLRGLHYQTAPHEEAKLVRCARGAAFVAVADIRADSPTVGQWLGVELTAHNCRALYVPPGCAQGYQTLADGTDMLYQMSVPYAPQFARGLRYDDASFGIEWPFPVTLLSAADAAWPPFELPPPGEPQ